MNPLYRHFDRLHVEYGILYASGIPLNCLHQMYPIHDNRSHNIIESLVDIIFEAALLQERP